MAAVAGHSLEPTAASAAGRRGLAGHGRSEAGSHGAKRCDLAQAAFQGIAALDGTNPDTGGHHRSGETRCGRAYFGRGRSECDPATARLCLLPVSGIEPAAVLDAVPTPFVRLMVPDEIPPLAESSNRAGTILAITPIALRRMS